MFHVVLYQPEIPPNTGNVIRLCANTGAELHLIEPLGFTLDDAKLRRAGLDYREYARIQVHRDFAAFLARVTPARLYAFSVLGTRAHSSARYVPGDALIFGPESGGLPEPFLERVPKPHVLRLPMVPGSRSLNLSNTVAVAVYEAWRQLGYVGAG